MATILVAPAMFTGHLLPHLAVAQALRRLGHTVYVYAEEAARPFVEQSGCSYLVMPCDDLRQLFLTVTTLEQSVAAFASVAGRAAPELHRLLDDLHIECVVTDSMHLGAALAAERSGVPWATLSTTPYESHGNFADTPLRKIPTAELRRRLGLGETDRDSYEQSLSPRLRLLPWTAEFDGGAMPEGSALIGPLTWEPSSASGEYSENGENGERLPDWLATPGPESPLVLVTVSSLLAGELLAYSQEYVDITISTLARLPVCGAVGLGVCQAPELIPDNIFTARHLPHGRLIQRTRVLVTHCGWGSISRALYAGVPMVLVPFAADQPGNAELCENAGVGIYLPPELLSEIELAGVIEELLVDDCPQRRRVTGMAAALRQARPADTAARRITELINES